MKKRKIKKDQFLIKFGERIRKYRLQKGYSQEELAYKAGLHWTYISGIERGLRNITIKNVRRVAKALGRKTKELFD